jgi:hypothetical protein
MASDASQTFFRVLIRDANGELSFAEGMTLESLRGVPPVVGDRLLLQHKDRYESFRIVDRTVKWHASEHTSGYSMFMLEVEQEPLSPSQEAAFKVRP